MLDLVKYSFDLYVLLKKIFNFVNSGEFTDEIIYITKDKLMKKLNDLLEMFNDSNNDIKKDKFIIPAIFNLLRRINFKTKSAAREKNKRNVSLSSENIPNVGLELNDKVKNVNYYLS